MNTIKYEALAYQNNQLSNTVSEHWSEWLALVEGAPWLSSFKSSPLLRGQTRARTPAGSIVDGWPRFKSHAVADALFSTAVWGFGVERKHETDVFWKKELARLQGLTAPSLKALDLVNRLEPLPVPFKDLDNWLEHLN